MRSVTVDRVFMNELGEEISMSVTYDEKGITVVAIKPEAEVTTTWTPLEAGMVRDLIDLVAFNNYSPQT
jgi:hypothetical protein